MYTYGQIKEVYMKTVLTILMAAIITVGFSATTPPAGRLNPTLGNGYITIDRSVVILPQRLKWGDKIALFNIHGRKVLEEYVGGGFLEVDVSKLPGGFYTILVSRNNAVIAAKVIPILGSVKG